MIISASTWEKHLGNHLDASNSDRHISEATHLLYFRVNSMMHKFCLAATDLKYFIFKSYCMSLYGCQLWNFESVCANKFYVGGVSAVDVYWMFLIKPTQTLFTCCVMMKMLMFSCIADS